MRQAGLEAVGFALRFLPQVGKLLEQQAFVHSSAQVGNVLRVMVASDLQAPEHAVSEVIRSNGLGLTLCRLANPGLEDVFVAATRARKSRSCRRRP
mgnify:CR=1 FL=1